MVHPLRTNLAMQSQLATMVVWLLLELIKVILPILILVMQVFTNWLKIVGPPWAIKLMEMNFWIILEAVSPLVMTVDICLQEPPKKIPKLKM